MCHTLVHGPFAGCRGDAHRPRVQRAMPTTRSSVAGVESVKSRILLCLWTWKLPILHATDRGQRRRHHHMRNNQAGVVVASHTVVPVRLGTHLYVTKSRSSTGVAVSPDDVPFSCRWSSLRELMSQSLQLLLFLADGRLCTLRSGGSLKGPITLLHVIFNHLSQGSSL